MGEALNKQGKYRRGRGDHAEGAEDIQNYCYALMTLQFLCDAPLQIESLQ
jgi:hypothetical protein